MYAVDDLVAEGEQVERDAMPSSASTRAQPGASPSPPEEGAAYGVLDRVFAALRASGGARSKPDGGVMMRCLFHDDRHPSAVVYAGSAAFWCSVCRGGPLSLREWASSRQGRDLLGDSLVEELLSARGCGPVPVNASVHPEPRTQDRLESAAFHGLAGAIVRAIEPHTEADPVALLLQLLVMFGNVIGRHAYVRADGARHYANLFLVLIGLTAKGRKGTALARIREVFPADVDEWKGTRIQGGLSSGEGIITAVRDASTRLLGGKTVEDAGVADKRLLILEEEFAKVLRVAEREGSTLSATLRQLWDGGSPRILTKNSPAMATAAHVSVVGHVTADELKRYLRLTETANGFGNRFLWACVRRAQVLPFGGEVDGHVMAPLTAELNDAIKEAMGVGEVGMTGAAQSLWRRVYPRLSEGGSGIVGGLTARAEAQALRLALNFALLDGRSSIDEPQLSAALAVVRYVDTSVRAVFGDAAGSADAEAILRALIGAPEGMTKTAIRDLFSRNRSGQDVDRALDDLGQQNRVHRVDEPSGGRPASRWFATALPGRATNSPRVIGPSPNDTAEVLAAE
ncbi:hypothetical protein BH11MYX4_BH11MYX4_22600 [soil metagenome]